MRRRSIIAGALLATPLAFSWQRSGQAQEDWRKRLEGWYYPESNISSGGSTGSQPTVTVKSPNSYSHASMTTSDSIDDVVKFYEAKTKNTLTPIPFKGYAQLDDGATLFTDDSEQRPLTLRLFQRHTKTESITLMISRGEGEKKTHIYWSYVVH